VNRANQFPLGPALPQKSQNGNSHSPDFSPVIKEQLSDSKPLKPH
jgi:hypothetical protein